MATSKSPKNRKKINRIKEHQAKKNEGGTRRSIELTQYHTRGSDDAVSENRFNNKQRKQAWPEPAQSRRGKRDKKSLAELEEERLAEEKKIALEAEERLAEEKRIALEAENKIREFLLNMKNELKKAKDMKNETNIDIITATTRKNEIMSSLEKTNEQIEKITLNIKEDDTKNKKQITTIKSLITEVTNILTNVVTAAEKKLEAEKKEAKKAAELAEAKKEAEAVKAKPETNATNTKKQMLPRSQSLPSGGS